MTSSYSRRFFRESKLRSSTFFWAPSIRRRDHLALDRLAVLHPEPGQDVGDPLAGELPHQVVFEREEEPRRAGVALAAGPAPELVVDPPALVPLGPDDVQAADRGDLAALGLHLGLVLGDGRLPDLLGDLQAGRVERPAVLVLQALEVGPGHELGVAAEDDVGPAAGHVGGDRDHPLPAGLGDDLGLLLVELGVEDLVLDPVLAEHVGDQLRLLDRRRADQDRPAGLVDLADLLEDRVVLLAVGPVDDVGEALAGQAAGWSGSR